MKLHKILLRHAGPKSQIECTWMLVLVDSEQAILDRLADDDGFTYGFWTNRMKDLVDEKYGPAADDDGNAMLPIYDEDSVLIGHENYMERMLRLRGEFNDSDASFDDAYYGIKHWGWDEGVEISSEQATILLDLKIAEDWRPT